MDRPRRVWITRARPGAEATAARLTALGMTPVVAPLLEVRPLDGVLNLADVAAIAFTSANAVAALADRTPVRALRVFAVGDATAAAARERGFADVSSAAGDVSALARLIVAKRSELAGPVLYPSAAEPAQDLSALLAAAGVAVRQAPLYETSPLAPSAEFAAQLGEIDAVLVHSARAGRVLAEFAAGQDVRRLTAYCLSPAIAETLAGVRLARVEAAAAPNEAVLLAMLSR